MIICNLYVQLDKIFIVYVLGQWITITITGLKIIKEILNLIELFKISKPGNKLRGTSCPVAAY
jgi:hypothetical protein